MFKTIKNFITHGKVVNIKIVYELGASSSNVNNPTLKNCLFGTVTLTENADIEKYINIQGMVLDLIEDQVFHLLTVNLVKMC